MTYRRIAAVLLPIALVVAIGLGVWGYQVNQDKRKLLVQSENQYQRAFHDLNFHVDKLQDELGKTRALNSQKQLSTSLSNVWRLCYAAQRDLSQLPLSQMPTDKTEKFLGRLGTFAYRTGVRDLNKKPLTQKEYATLNSLYQNTNTVQGDLKTVQNKALNNNLQWMDVERAFSEKNQDGKGNDLISGFKKVDKLSEGFSEVDLGPAVKNPEQDQRKLYARIKGETVTPTEVKEKIADILERPNIQGIKVSKSNNGNYPVYSIRLQEKNGKQVTGDLTQKGGYVLWMDYDRQVNQRKLSPQNAQGEAVSFLDRLGYPQMELISYGQSGNFAVFTFVRNANGTLFYPESVSVKVAMDNGEITGFRADQYVFNHLATFKTKPTLTQAQARKSVNTHLKVQKVRTAVIYGDQGGEVLCYEFMGQLDKIRYRVFINAKSGDEEYVEKIKENGTMKEL
ncbi:spore germination protein [Marininema mesophilum]|uniref:Spore germination protein n=1 Tax=Marininema mesophilum TaxID=1048340 RepID=A0A1H2UQ50_9BACL|nr:germination protein YpeB [Marininema mesophilum]SDW58211.1 spore germination protein [Marininema mesophilum]